MDVIVWVGYPINGPGLAVDKLRVDYVRARAIFLLIAFANLCFHPGLDLRHGLVECFTDQFFDDLVAVYSQVNSNLQEQIKGQVVWVDEAGFLSVRQMLELQESALHHNCRLILTGDTKQHHSVQWGDALRILERSGAIAQAALTKIYRQKLPGLREAVEDLSRGRTGEGFDTPIIGISSIMFDR
jgi:AAA domain